MRGDWMREVWLMKRPGKRLLDDVTEALNVLSREGIASSRSLEHPGVLLVLNAHWHRAFQILVAANFDVM
jgi:hypothetical protein